MAESWGRIRTRTQSGRRSFYLDFRPLARIWSMPSGRAIRTRAQAERLLRDIRADFRQGSKSQEAVLADYQRRTAPGLTVRAKYAKWLAAQEVRLAAGEITGSYLRELRRYGRTYLGPIAALRVDRVTFANLEDLDHELARAELAPRTRRHVQRTLKTFYHWLKKRDDVDVVPRFPVVSVVEREPRTLTAQQQRAVLDAIPEDRRGVFLGLAQCVLRPSEAARLDVADYDWRAGVMTLPSSKAKTRRAAAVPASPELRAWIERHVEREGRLRRAPLFTNPLSRQEGGRWSVDAMEKTWERAIRSLAGVPYASLYEGTKHTTLTNARRSGVPLEVLQAAARHADVRSTQVYARIADLAPVGSLVAGLSLDSDDSENHQKDGQTR